MECIKLRSDVQVLNRANGVIQIGLSPITGCRLTGSQAEMLRLLDGTRTAQQIVAESAEPAGTAVILTALQQRGLLEHQLPLASGDPVMRASQLRSSLAHLDIRVHGGGRLGTTIALLLAGEGITSVRVSDSRPVAPTDVTPWGASRIDLGVRRDRVAALLIERMHRGALDNHLRPRARGSVPFDVVVCDQVADWPWFNPMQMDALVATDIPHIAVCATRDAAAISHVVIPGRSACIRCGHHAQTDMDPDWPMVSEQLARRPAIDTASLTMVLRAATATIGRIEQWCANGEQEEFLVVQEDGSTTNSATTAHPMCGCSWNRAA